MIFQDYESPPTPPHPPINLKERPKPFEISTNQESVATLLTDLEAELAVILDRNDTENKDEKLAQAYKLYLKVKKIRPLLDKAYAGEAYLQDAANRVFIIQNKLFSYVEKELPNSNTQSGDKEVRTRNLKPLDFINRVWKGIRRKKSSSVKNYEKREVLAQEIELLVENIFNVRKRIIEQQKISTLSGSNNPDSLVGDLYTKLVKLETKLHQKQFEYMLLPDNLENPLEEIPLMEIREKGDPLFEGERYDLNVERLDGGVTGDIFICNDKKLKRQVVIKKIRYVEGTTWQTSVTRLIAEARTQAKFNTKDENSRFVAAYDIFKDEKNNVYFVMEYDEKSIDAYEKVKEINNKENDPNKLKKFFKKFIETSADAVARANKRVSHRDIKTANFLIDDTGSAKLIDFGMASTVIPTTVSYGTPAYLSMHRLHGSEYNLEEDDIYALATVYFELLMGERQLGSSQKYNSLSEKLWNLHANKPIDEMTPNLWSQVAENLSKRLRELGIQESNIKKIVVIFGKAFNIRNPEKYDYNQKGEAHNEKAQTTLSGGIAADNEEYRRIEWASVTDFAKELAGLFE